jgi:hypothetical protein
MAVGPQAGAQHGAQVAPAQNGSTKHKTNKEKLLLILVFEVL